MVHLAIYVSVQEFTRIFTLSSLSTVTIHIFCFLFIVKPPLSFSLSSRLKQELSRIFLCRLYGVQFSHARYNQDHYSITSFILSHFIAVQPSKARVIKDYFYSHSHAVQFPHARVDQDLYSFFSLYPVIFHYCPMQESVLRIFTFIAFILMLSNSFMQENHDLSSFTPSTLSHSNALHIPNGRVI